MKSDKPIEKIYQKKTQLEHILLRPDTYIGSVEMQKDKLWVFDTREEKLEFREINYVPGLYKIFDEILVNAADNYQRSKNTMTYIRVTIDKEKNRISVKNNGKGIPIQIHKEYDIYIPELIFGHLLTSSNYDDNEKKVTGGRNGYGAKLTNIFSKLFIVETADRSTKKYFKQVYKNNMSHKGSPEIKDYDKNEEFTCITFEPDLPKFKMDKLDEDIVALMTKRVYDMAGVTPADVKVYINDKKIEIKNFNSYIDMYLNSLQEEAPVKVYEKPHERWEVAVALSEGQFQQVSYVNSISTSKGGTHVTYVTDKIVDHVLEVINKKNKKLNIKGHNVKQHLWVFVNCLIENPSFDSQTKENMTLKSQMFGSSFNMSEKFMKEVIKTGIVDHVLHYAKTREELKMTKQLNAGSRKTGRLLGIPKLDDANNAGTKNSHLCTLILTEGDSAKSLAMAGVEVVGRDNFGVFPLRGKMLNVREAKNSQITNNEEIQNLIKILGLQVGKQYEEIKSLRYGSIMIMTDQDHDGSHIKGLIINFIHHFWPSLIKLNGFLREFITPIIKATKGSEVLSFYTIPEYKAWVDSIAGNTKNWHIKYYKGLGTSTSREAQEYFSQIQRHKIEFEYVNQKDDEAIELAFNKSKADDRKTWLANYDPNTDLQDSEIATLRYEDFINKEFILFSLSDNQRSIPNICDGLKPSERKILFSCFKRKLKAEIKVAQLTGYVSEHSAYHHGEQSLNSTIVAMAQNFVGSNNVNLLMPLGQFGTRNQGGKEAASARYIFTNLNKVTRHLFNENDDPLMDYIVEEGQKIEPNWYLPIIPLVLVNGADGIGTGWSTNIPCFNPREIIDNIKHKIKTGNFMEMRPWYKGFQGEIVKNENKNGYTITGKFEWKDDILVITELPVKKWTRDYKEFLDKLMGIESSSGKDTKEKEKKKKKKNEEGKEEEKKEKEFKEVIIEDIREYHTNNRVHFEIKLLPDYLDEYRDNPDKVIKKFKLSSSIPLSNMVCFDHNQKIRKYNSVEEILEEFFELRVEYYDRRKDYLLSALKRDLEVLDNKVRFILAVINEEIIIKKRKKKEIISDLVKQKYTPMSKINEIKRKNKSEELTQVPENNPDEDKNEEEEDDEDMPVPAKEYDYLLTMPLWSLSYEKVNELLKSKEMKAQEIETLTKTDVKDIWVSDLAEFVRELDAVEAKEEEDRLGGPKIKGKGGRTVKARGGKGKANKADDEDYEEETKKGAAKGKKAGGDGNKAAADKGRDKSADKKAKPATTNPPFNKGNNEKDKNPVPKKGENEKPENNINKPTTTNTHLNNPDNPFIKAVSQPKETDISQLSLRERLALKMSQGQDSVPKINPNVNMHRENQKRRKEDDDLDIDEYIFGSLNTHKPDVGPKQDKEKPQVQPQQGKNQILGRKPKIIQDDDEDDDEDFSTNLDDKLFKF